MPKPLSRLDALHSLRVANVDAALATAFATLVSGTFLVGYIKFLGGSDAWVNLLAALPSLFGILQIPGAIIGRGFASYKRFVLPGGLLWRLLYIPFALLPFVAISGDLKLVVVACCVSLAAACTLFVNSIYNDWLAELVPASSRGWYFGRRQVIATAVGATVGVLGGVLLDGFKRAGEERAGFGTIFGIGLLCAAASFVFFLRMHDLTRAHPVRQSLRDGLASMSHPVRDRDFRRVLVFLGVFVVGQTIAGNLFSAFALESLDLSFTILTIAGATHAVGIVAFTRLWGYLADKYGNRPVLFLLCVGVTLTPVMWLFCKPGAPTLNALLLIPGHVFSGAMWGGATLCQLNILLATAKPEDRANYIGVGLAAQALVGGLAPLLGGELMSIFRQFWEPEIAYKVLFGVTMLARIVAVVPLLYVNEEGSVRLREALRHIRKVTPKGFGALRSLSRSETPDRREQAIHRVGAQGLSLALSEIIEALHDPSPSVRRQAAQALAKLRDPAAVPALIHMLNDHPDLADEETFEALGELGQAEAVEPLVRYLQSPVALTRRAAARALGKIGNPAAIEPLLAAAADFGDADLRRASLQALRLLGAKEAEPIFAAALLDPLPSIRIAAAEAVADFELRGAAGAVRESLTSFFDEGESEVAYALGAVGDPSDLERILDFAQRCESMITRRRCLLGAARLLDVEQAVYRLLLMEGFARDSALIELLRPATRKSARMRAALDRFASGDEAGALQALAKALPSETLDALARRPVNESFLVAAAWIAAGMSPPQPR